ncbi:MAG: hypothetical protein LBF89_11005 [Bacteroidales bacterium]|jgi:hypothetical protein|nr:hypothetical protein [Bacteroidales bacterium]
MYSQPGLELIFSGFGKNPIHTGQVCQKPEIIVTSEDVVRSNPLIYRHFGWLRRYAPRDDEYGAGSLMKGRNFSLFPFSDFG